MTVVANEGRGVSVFLLCLSRSPLGAGDLNGLHNPDRYFREATGGGATGTYRNSPLPCDNLPLKKSVAARIFLLLIVVSATQLTMTALRLQNEAVAETITKHRRPPRQPIDPFEGFAMRRFFLTFLAAALLLVGLNSSHGADARPNIILIMADDIGYECFGCYGSKQYDTPNIDRMAEQGMRFTHCYSQPLCTPSRVKIMTGLSNVRNYSAFFGFEQRPAEHRPVFSRRRLRNAGCGQVAVAGRGAVFGTVSLQGELARAGRVRSDLPLAGRQAGLALLATPALYRR